MKPIFYICAAIAVLLGNCDQSKPGQQQQSDENPLFPAFNQPINFDAVTPEHLNEATETIIAKSNATITSITEVSNPTYSNTLLALDDLVSDMFKVNAVGYLIGNTHTDSLLRTTALQKSVELRKYSDGVFQNKELYKKIKAFAQSDESKKLDDHQKKFLGDILGNFERNGMQLSNEDLEKLKQLKTEITDLTTKFSTNINAYQDYLEITEADAVGLPESYKKQRRTEEGTYKIDMTYPSIRPFLKFSPSEDLRKQLIVKFSNRASDSNIEVLDQLLARRHDMAQLLGFPSYAAYNLSDRMAKDPKNVWAFEEDLIGKVKAKAQQDYDELLQTKKADKSSRNTTNRINRWDLSYYTEKLKQDKYQVSSEEVKAYFPMESALEGVFSITQNLFGLEYKEVTSASVWHPDVKMYEVYKDDKLTGRFYLDLYPRPNKYTHMACFPMRPGKETDQGYQLPMASLVCNFPQPTEDTPSLLSHGQLETLFHEFGHVLHNMLYKSELASQSRVKRDFVEAPSQIFENWTWEYEALKLFAKHYQTGEVLPKSLFDKMVAAKNVNSGLNAQSQIFLGVYDFTLHDKYSNHPEFSTDAVAKEVSERILLVPRVIDGTHFQASFGHLTGYGASYYGYLWSLVYAQDMYSLFEQNGPMDENTGQRYADIILASGSSKEEIDLVREFLGREPNNQAFIRSLGL